MALSVALAVSAVLSLSATLVYQLASVNQSDAQLRRVQSQALDAAEGGLNRSYQDVQLATTANLPCGSNAISEALPTVPSPSSYSVSVDYFDTFPPTDAALSCASVHSGSATPLAAEMISTGSNRTTSQYMEALVKLTLAAPSGTVFDQAVFSNQTIIGANNPTVDGHYGNDANVYSNGGQVCGNNMLVQGNLTVQGAFTGANNCTINGNVTAVGNISGANNMVIGGNATSTGNAGCSSQGNINLANNSIVDQSAYAYCGINLVNNASVVHSQVPNDTTLTNPPTETFPSVPMPTSGSSAAAAWAAAGYTNQITDNNCASTGVYQDISNMNSSTTPTVIMTSCALTWSNNSSISLNQNLAIFSTGGFTMLNNTSWQSTNSTTRLLYLLVPSSSGGTNTQCTLGQPGIDFANNTSFSSTLNVLDYTPCTITVANNSTGYGQLYGGQISVANNFTTHYVPLPTVPGSSGGGSTGSSTTTIAVVYERQISSLAQA
ncbi:MAG: bactofilin family protein [Acidimicrobiales bacterium]